MTDLTGITGAERERLDQLLRTHVDRSGDCWLWTRSLTAKGYGQIGVDLPVRWLTVSAHRLAYMLGHGLLLLPASTLIRHRCDAPACVRLDHLEPGTAAQNSRDMSERGRHRSGFVGLSEDEIERNRRRHQAALRGLVAFPAPETPEQERRRLYGA